MSQFNHIDSGGCRSVDGLTCLPAIRARGAAELLVALSAAEGVELLVVGALLAEDELLRGSLLYPGHHDVLLQLIRSLLAVETLHSVLLVGVVVGWEMDQFNRIDPGGPWSDSVSAIRLLLLLVETREEGQRATPPQRLPHRPRIPIAHEPRALMRGIDASTDQDEAASHDDQQHEVHGDQDVSHPFSLR